MLHLQRGDQQGALQQIWGWRPKGSDAYVHVLRGSLLSEVGEAAGALQVLEQAIQVLRRQQRSRPGSPELISQEAWACLIARNIQRALEFGSIFRIPSPSEQPSVKGDEAESENFEHRLNALGARGYSARQELESLMADLNAEAPLPHGSQSRLRGFDLGSGSSRWLLTQRSELSDKINASLSWLELVERTGLPPQTRNTSFFVEQMLQAAWWSRFADTPQRSIGLLLRTHRKNALEARDNSLPLHRSGWLGRDEIARFPAQSAMEICTELMKQVCAEIEGTGASEGYMSRSTFFLEVFSHLVVRVQSEELLQKWGKQLLELHLTTAVRTGKNLWDPLSRALGRIVEALPGPAQSRLILQAAGSASAPVTPELSVSEHELFRWLDLRRLFRHWEPDADERSSVEWRSIAQRLTHQLRTALDAKTIQQTWIILVNLREKGLLSNAEQKEIGMTLWANVEPDQWPIIPGYYPMSTLLWPAPRRDAPSRFLSRMVGQPLLPFNSGGYMVMTIGNGRRSYQLGGLDTTLGSIYRAMSETTPTLPQIGKLIDAVNGWFDAQLGDLVQDLCDEQLHREVFRAIGFLDDMFVLCITLLTQRPLTARVQALLERVKRLDGRLQALKFPRYQVSLALIRCDKRPVQALDDHLRSLIEGLAAADEQVLWRAARAAYGLLKEEDSRFHGAAKMLFDAVVACVFAQRVTCMKQTMNLLANLPHSAWRRNLDQKSLTLLDISLADLAIQLAYDPQGSAETLSDELVPILRFGAFELAYALIHTAKASAPAAQSWLDAAKDDPLPEVRLGRFQRSIKDSA